MIDIIIKRPGADNIVAGKFPYSSAAITTGVERPAIFKKVLLDVINKLMLLKKIRFASTVSTIVLISTLTLLVFYNYPKQIRASIYSTNMIESFNNVIKRKAKPKAEFPTEQSLDAFIGIQAMSYNDRYFNRIYKGFGQVQDTLESYFD